jgi:hypothetical protein
MLALSPSPTNNAGIATAPLLHNKVEDRGDIMAKSRKILGSFSCTSYAERPRADFILAFLGTFWISFKQFIQTYILQINIGFSKKKHSKIGIDIFFP